MLDGEGGVGKDRLGSGHVVRIGKVEKVVKLGSMVPIKIVKYKKCRIK